MKLGVTFVLVARLLDSHTHPYPRQDTTLHDSIPPIQSISINKIDQNQQNLTRPTPTTMSDDPTPEVHPIYARSRFPQTIKWRHAIYDAAVLATRLMDTPQALQHDYCVFFGTNTAAKLCHKVRRKTTQYQRPKEYGCSKGVGELEERDIQVVRDERLKLSQRITFRVGDIQGDCGECKSQPAVPGIKGVDSIITIGNTLYQAARDKDRSAEENARMTFLLASTMLHEVAHAAQRHMFGGSGSYEDFRQTGLIAEAGHELESRIYGVKPDLYETNLTSGACKWSSWQCWMAGVEIIRYTSRQRFMLDEECDTYRMDTAFVMKLCDDNFWLPGGEYARRGAKALVPREIARICRDERDDYLQEQGDIRANLRVSLSIRDLFRRRGTPSYAQRLYPHLSNPDLVLRNEQPAESDVSTDYDSDPDIFGYSDSSSDVDTDVDGEEEDGSDDGDEEDGSDVDEDGSADEMDVDEDDSVAEDDGMDIDEDESPAPKIGNKRTQREVSSSNEEEDPPARKKKTKNSRRN